MATTSITDKLAKLEKKIAKREKTIADETKELDKDKAEYNKLYIMFLSDKYKLSGKDLFSAIESDLDELEKLRDGSVSDKDSDSKKATPKKEWRYDTDYRALHGEFPELVDENGNGWYIRHLHNICDFVNANRDKVGSSGIKLADSIKALETDWRKKLTKLQVPIFNEKTKGDTLIRFDDCIADALELGALRREPINLTEKQKQWLKENTPEEVPLYVSETLLEYYLANKPADSEWCVLPITNIEAYLGSSSLSKSYILLLSGKVLERKSGTSNVCVARFYLPE